MSAALQQRRYHYAFMVAAAFRSVPSVLIMPLGKEFGWSHALIGGAVSVNLIVYGLGAPFAAAIVARSGGRSVVRLAPCEVPVGAGLSAFMTQPGQLYLLWGGVIGSATGAL